MSITEEIRAEHRDLSIEDYHMDLTHDSPSSVALFDQSPALYYHSRISQRIPYKPSTPVQRLGSAAHTIILEPEKYDEVVIVIPQDVLAKDGSKKGKAYDTWKWNEARGKLDIKQADADAIRWMRDNVWEHKRAAELLTCSTVREYSVFWTDKAGHKRKARFDGVLEMDRIFVDLKTSCDPGEAWWRQIKQMGTHRQGAWYSDAAVAYYGARYLPEYIVIRNEAPYDVFVWTLPIEALRLGARQNRETLAKIKACRESGRWHYEWHGESRQLPIPVHFYPFDEE